MAKSEKGLLYSARESIGEQDFSYMPQTGG